MKRTVLLGFLLLLPPLISASPLSDLFTEAEKENTTYRVAAFDRELAEMNLEKDMIQAANEKEEFTARVSYLSSLSGYRENLKTFYTETIDAVIEAAVKNIKAETAEINSTIAYEDYLHARSLLEKGLASEEEVKETFLSYKEKRIQMDQAQWDMKDALNNYREKTGMEWDISVSSHITIFDWTEDEDGWIGQDLSVQRMELEKRIAQYDLDNLPSNVSRYEKRGAAMQLEKAELSHERAILTAHRNYRRVTQNLTYLKGTILNLREKLELQESKLADVQNRCEKKLIAQRECDQQKIQCLSVEQSYMENLREFMRALLEYIISTGQRPEEVLL